MSGADRPRPLFADRHHAGESLYFGRLSDAGLVDALVLALTPGGVEVAYPYAFLLGASLHHLPAEAFAAPEPLDDTRVAPRVRAPSPHVVVGVAGRDVVLVDDGLGPLAALLLAARALRAGGPRRLVMAVPAMTSVVARLFQPRVVERVITAGRFPRGPLRVELYGRPEPPTAAFAHGLLASVAHDRQRRGPAVAPHVVAAAHAGLRGVPSGAADGPRGWSGPSLDPLGLDN